jgi:hypothetical protein
MSREQLGPYVPQPDSGTIFTAKDKRTSNHPDVYGDIHLSRGLLERAMQQEGDPVKVSLSGWRKESKITGTKYLSLSFSIKEPYAQAESKPKPAYDANDDDVPF